MKREIRILGLDCCNDRFVVGVVTRGGLYLDGVFTLRDAKTADLARKVIGTKYFPELRAIMIHGSNPAVDANVVERTTSLPVITIPIDHQVRGRGYRNVRLGKNCIPVKSKMDSQTLMDTLSLTTLRAHLPEPVRIAHLLAKLSLTNVDQAR